jgi:hypothetical protein
MWESIGFENLSVEVLAYVWEKTLVSRDLRKKLGIHATPPSIARYIVHRLPIGSIPQADRRVVEPCCGSGTFLIAALQRLRELLPAGMDARQRHNYFVPRLAGFDVDQFGLEVARSALMLADYPNPNGWTLKKEDVFEDSASSPTFSDAILNARIVLCNPPFSDFTEKERQVYKPQSVHKPAELLLRVSQSLPEGAVIGFVLPRVFLDGRGYREAREAVARRFEEIELVNLPDDRVFESARHKTTLLIAMTPRQASRTISIFHRKVCDTGAPDFLNRYQASREDRAAFPEVQVCRSIGVPDLQDIWERLKGHPKLGELTSGVHRGIEWNIPLTRMNPMTRNREFISQNARKLISRTPASGYHRGVKDVPRDFYSFQMPSTCYLNCNPEYQRTNAYKLPWNDSKVILNASRKSTGPWRIVACADLNGLVFYQTFTCVWPTGPWKPDSIAAILNSPLSNAYVAANEYGRHITGEVIKEIPMPDPSRLDQAGLCLLVEQYVSVLSTQRMLSGIAQGNQAHRILRQIDALILKAYELPARLERQLLEYFRGHRRQVPFDFGPYYPEGFNAYIPLAIYDSDRFQRSTAQDFLDRFPRIDDPDLLDTLADL